MSDGGGPNEESQPYFFFSLVDVVFTIQIDRFPIKSRQMSDIRH